MRSRLADEKGQASAELMGMLFWLLLATVVVKIPIIVPGLTAAGFNAERSAELPGG